MTKLPEGVLPVGIDRERPRNEPQRVLDKCTMRLYVGKVTLQPPNLPTEHNVGLDSSSTNRNTLQLLEELLERLNNDKTT